MITNQEEPAMAPNKVDKAPKDIKAGLLVTTIGNHIWTLSEPDEDGLRTVQLNGNEEGRGILLGSVEPIAMGFMTKSPNVEVDRRFGIKFPDRPESKCILISYPVTAIMIKGGKSQNKEYQVKRLRILPRNSTDIRPHLRVQVLGEDHMGFTIVEAQLKPEEGVCWRCGSVAEDPDHNLQICPVCGKDFND